MKNSHLKQFDYENWANLLTINSIKQANEPDERALQLISHILSAHSIWLCKIKDEKPTIGLWDLFTLDECLERSNNNHENWIRFISSVNPEEFERHIQFNFLGKESKISIGDIMTHIINHSSYHRGQIIAGLKGKLEPLPLTTYIAFAKSDS